MVIEIFLVTQTTMGLIRTVFSAMAKHFVGKGTFNSKNLLKMSYFVLNILQIPNSFVTNKMLPALKIILTSIDPRTITD